MKKNKKIIKVTEEFYKKNKRMEEYIKRLYNPKTRVVAKTFEEVCANKIVEIITNEAYDEVIKITKKKTWLHKHKYIEIIKKNLNPFNIPTIKSKSKIKIYKKDFNKYKFIIEVEYYDQNLPEISEQINLEKEKEFKEMLRKEGVFI
jgi:hypothetical protein